MINVSCMGCMGLFSYENIFDFKSKEHIELSCRYLAHGGTPLETASFEMLGMF
jgi:hypothetical protein